MIRTLTAVSAVMLATAPVHAGALSPDHPDVLICPIAAIGNVPAGHAFLFLSALGDNGSVLYQSLGNRSVSAIYDADGNLMGLGEKVCGGKSLQQLAADGQTKDF